MKQAVNLAAVQKAVNTLIRKHTYGLTIEQLELGTKYSFGDCLTTYPIAGRKELLRLNLHPTKKSTYWRAGFKFGRTKIALPLPKREDFEHPLLHLTCNDAPSPVLGITYYHDNEEDKEASGVILENYDGSPVTLVLYHGVDNELIAAVQHKRKVIYARKLTSLDDLEKASQYTYKWVSSWGDQYTYDLRAKLLMVVG